MRPRPKKLTPLLYCLFIFFIPILSFAQNVPTDGLVAQWKLDDGTGKTVVNAINQSTSNLVNAQWSTGVSGLPTSAVTLTGTGSYINLSSFNNLAFPNSGSLSFWINGDFTNQNNLNVFDAYRTGANHLFIRGNNSVGGIQIAFQKANGNYAFLTLVSIPTNQWTLITIVWDINNHIGHIYKNGDRIFSNAIVNNVITNSTIPIDLWSPSGQSCVFGNGFNGSLDNIVLYNRVISPAESKAMFTGSVMPLQDTIPNPMPQLFAATSINAYLNNVGWSTSTDPDIAGYLLYKNGQPYTIVSKNASQWSDANIVPPGSTTTYSINSFDYSGNSSVSTATSSVNFDSTKLIFKSDFEADQIFTNSPILAWNKQNIRDSAIIITTEQARAGNKSLKFNLNSADYTAGNIRSEVISNFNGPAQFSLSQTYWVGFSELIAADWKSDYPTNPEIVWQFHGDDNGPAGGSPPLSANIVGDSLKINLQSGTTPSINGLSTVLATILIPKGAWSDWVVQVKFDYTNGLVRVWRNCELIADYTGPTLYPKIGMTNQNGPYLKFGLYKWDWKNQATKISNHSLYVDEIRIAKGTSSFKDVQPTGANPCAFLGTYATAGLEGLWNLNEGSGTAANDVSYKKRPGVIQNGAWSISNSTNVLSLPSGNSQISFPLIDSTNFPQSGSLSFWIYGDFSTQNSLRIFDDYRTNGNHLFIRTNTSVNGIQIAFQKVGGAYAYINTMPIQANTWTQVSIVWDAINHYAYIYKNGSLFASGIISKDVAQYSTRIMPDTWTPSGQKFIFGTGFNGSIRDIALYKRNLTQTDNQAIYTGVMLPKIDADYPTAPTDFRASAITGTEMKLSWGPSYDTSGTDILSGYLLSRNGIPIALLPISSLSYSDTGLINNSSYNYSLVGFDYSGNQSTAAAVSNLTNLSSLPFKTDFEADLADVSAPIAGWQKAASLSSSVQVSNSRSRSGSRAVKFNYSLSNWTSSYTTDEIYSTYNGPSNLNTQQDWWIGFSEYIPANWTSDYETNSETIWRFKGAANGPSSNADLLTASVIGDSIKIYLQTKNISGGNQQLLASFINPKGSWIDWVVDVKYDYSAGYIKIWKNCVQFVDYTGPTLYTVSGQTNENGPSFRLGINKPFWGSQASQVSNRILYVDEVRIANNGTGFNQVKPNGTNACGADIEMLSDGLVSYWKFNEGAGSKVTDLTGNGFTGTMISPSWTAAGLTSSAALFGGISNQLYNTELNAAGFPVNGSISFWIKGDFTSQTGLNVFDSYRNADHIFIRTSSSVQGLQIVFQKANGNYAFICGMPITANTWTQVTVEWDCVNHIANVYKNGSQFIPSTSIVENVFDPSSAIDSWKPTGQNYSFGSGFTGILDNIALYSKNVSAAEIQYIYNNIASTVSLVTAGISPVQMLLSAGLNSENITTTHTGLNVYPNPATTRFKANFLSNTESKLTLRLIEISTGKQYYYKDIQAIKGMNTAEIEVSRTISEGAFILLLENAGTILNRKKLILGSAK